MRTQHEALVAEAARVSALHNRMDELRDSYRVYCVQQLRETKDPFYRPPKEKKRASPAGARPLSLCLLAVLCCAVLCCAVRA